jgi:two-component system, LytTR family, response regulator
MSVQAEIKALIVDDERLARNKLRAMLARHYEVRVVGEADSVRAAVEAIDSASPDVVFLDIQMPGETGFDLFDKVAGAFKVIFVTAFDEHAIRAFEVNALDYLLKPVSAERLARAIDRLHAEQGAGRPPERSLEYDDHLFLSADGKSRFLKVSSIKYIAAAGPYSEVHAVSGEKTFVLKSLKQWEERLPAKQFMRIHRSTIVNIECVERVERWFNNSYQIYLHSDKEPLTMSRRCAARLKEKMR